MEPMSTSYPFLFDAATIQQPVPASQWSYVTPPQGVPGAAGLPSQTSGTVGRGGMCSGGAAGAAAPSSAIPPVAANSGNQAVPDVNAGNSAAPGPVLSAAAGPSSGGTPISFAVWAAATGA